MSNPNELGGKKIYPSLPWRLDKTDPKDVAIIGGTSGDLLHVGYLNTIREENAELLIDAVNERPALMARIEKLKEYAKHGNECATNEWVDFGDPAVCDCGLEDALKP